MMKKKKIDTTVFPPYQIIERNGIKWIDSNHKFAYFSRELTQLELNLIESKLTAELEDKLFRKREKELHDNK